MREQEQAGLVLIVEDNRNISEMVGEYLESRGFEVDYAADGVDGYRLAAENAYDAIVLDLMLPRLDGIEVCRRLRAEARKSTPILMLTARDTLDDKLTGLSSGADDYLTKPFHLEELQARVRALLRRAGGHASSDIRCGPLVLDTRQSRIALDDSPLDLTSHEYRVLAYLMMHQGEVVSRTRLVEHIYAQDFDRDSNTIEVFIARLRRKIPADLIQTVRGLGYRLDAAPAP